MDESDDTSLPFTWAIEAEEVEFPGELTPRTFYANVIDTLDLPELAIAAAVAKLVKLPKAYELSPSTCFAEVITSPETVKLPPDTVLVKIADRPGVPSAPRGTVVIETHTLPPGEFEIGPLGIRVPPPPGGLTGRIDYGIRVPIIPPRIKRGR